MYKSLFGSLLIVAVILTPINFSHAGSESETQQALIGQLNALVSYLEETLNLGDSEPLSNDETREIIREGTYWLIEAQEKSGHFAYEYKPFTDNYLSGDNIVRQAGALYALGEVVRRDTESSVELNKTIEDAIEYFESISVEDEFLKVEFRCIVEKPGSDVCKLGATSLALIGILSYVDANPEKTENYEDLIEDYISYISVSRNLDTGFRNVHNIGVNQQPNKESAFSNGEALLALARYQKYNDTGYVAKLIDETYEYLSEQTFNNSLYLWIMAAVKDMNEFEPKESYAEYVKEFTDWRVSRIAKYRGTQKNYCSYIEGVASAYSVLEDSSTDAEKNVLREEIAFWNKKNSRLQIFAEDTYRAVVEDETLRFEMVEKMSQAEGGFLTSDILLTQRIDFTQHCIGAYIQTLVDIDGKEL